MKNEPNGQNRRNPGQTGNAQNSIQNNPQNRSGQNGPQNKKPGQNQNQADPSSRF